MKKKKTVNAVPDSIKGTGFFTPMDIAPGEYPSVDYAPLKAQILLYLERDWGPRCTTKDTDDFDDLITVGDPDVGRCPCCLVYEKFDNFWKYFEYEARV